MPKMGLNKLKFKLGQHMGNEVMDYEKCHKKNIVTWYLYSLGIPDGTSRMTCFLEWT